MTTLVVVLIVAVVIVAVAVYRRVFGSDARSIAGHQTMMDRLGRVERTAGTRQDHDHGAAAGVRVLEQTPPRSGRPPESVGASSPAVMRDRAVLTDDTLVHPRNYSSGREQPPGAAPTSASPGTYDHGGWGPPVEPIGPARPDPTTVPAGLRAPAGGGDGRQGPATTPTTLVFDDYAPASQIDESRGPRPPGATGPLLLDKAAARPRRFGSLSRPISRLIALAAIVVLIIVVAVVVISSGGTSRQPVAKSQRTVGGPSVSPPRPVAPSPTTHPVSQTRPPTRATTPARHVTKTTPTLPPGNRPGIAGISPASGAAGQVVTLTGRNLVSGNGLIVVRFGSVEAPVSCPARNVCRATIPTRASNPTAVEVTITTDKGTSNPVSFTYR